MLQSLPPELMAQVGSETQDFAVKAARAYPKSKIKSQILFGLIWTGLNSVIAAVVAVPILMGQEINMTSNGKAVVAGPGNWGPLLGPGLIIGLFVLIGLIILGSAIYMMLAPGPWFVGTPKRLIIFKKDSTKSIDWEEFTGDIELANATSSSASITLKMRTGRMVSRKNRPAQYVPDEISLAGIEDAINIERVMRQRIKENDPTPPASSAAKI